MVILLHTCFCTQLHTNWRTCAHTNSLRIHNVSGANFEKYGYVAKIRRGKLKNFVECLAFYLCVMVWKKDFLCSCPVERKGYCISSIFFLYFNPKVCKRLPRVKNHKSEKKSWQISLFSSNFQFPILM